VLYFAGWKQHFSLYQATDLVSAFKDDLAPGGAFSEQEKGMDYSRQRAISLRAAKIGEVLATSGFLLILPKLTAAQLVQLQRYLDAAVVDPVVQQEADAWYRKGTKYYGQLVIIDEAMKHRADKAMHDYIVIGKLDDRVRLNITQIIDDTTFAPKTDNPDEAEYLERVHKTLDARGVWLRLAPQFVRDAEDPSRWVVDPRHFQVWLSLGPEGDTIPTKTGRIDSEALLGTTLFGAGYYDAVFRGPVRMALEREVQRLSSEIDDGMAQHFELARIRRSAAIGVVPVSDALGGASFPSEEIWNGPHQLLLRAMDLRNAGKIYGCRALLIIAAISVRNAAHLLAKYIDDTTSGGESAVKILKVARAAGKVAEVGLTITGVGALARGGAAVVGSATVSEASIDTLAEREVARYLAKNPELASELNQVRLLPGPKGTILGNVKGGHSAGYGKGFDSW
jgi:hypothetical protein